MLSLIEFFSAHAPHAHWFILIGLLLAGCNLPISIDVLVIIAALFSAEFVPENTILLYSFLLGGCLLSAWISYLLGRTVGAKLAKWRVFQSFLSDEKIEKLQAFYKKYGIFAFIVGRFIPFGIRNCLFMSSGLSKMPFLRFALQDFLACFIWVTTYFTLFYHIGQNFEVIWHYVKTLNVFLFLIFAVAVISVIWYKRTKSLQVSRMEKR
jgi:membrane protein DedA with SNARE-associated domain